MVAKLLWTVKSGWRVWSNLINFFMSYTIKTYAVPVYFEECLNSNDPYLIEQINKKISKDSDLKIIEKDFQTEGDTTISEALANFVNGIVPEVLEDEFLPEAYFYAFELLVAHFCKPLKANMWEGVGGDLFKKPMSTLLEFLTSTNFAFLVDHYPSMGDLGSVYYLVPTKEDVKNMEKTIDKILKKHTDEDTRVMMEEFNGWLAYCVKHNQGLAVFFS